MNKIKITKKQRKILAISGMVAAAFIIFMAAIYLPSSKRMNDLKKNYEVIDAEIKQIREDFGKGVSLEKAIDILKERLQDLEVKFPDKEEFILREISALASKIGLELVSVKPDKKKIIKDIRGVPVSIKGYVIQKMPIEIVFNSGYKDFGDFLKNSRGKFPIFITADNVRIRKQEGLKEGILRIELQVDTYVVSPVNG